MEVNTRQLVIALLLSLAVVLITLGGLFEYTEAEDEQTFPTSPTTSIITSTTTEATETTTTTTTTTTTITPPTTTTHPPTPIGVSGKAGIAFLDPTKNVVKIGGETFSVYPRKAIVKYIRFYIKIEKGFEKVEGMSYNLEIEIWGYNPLEDALYYIGLSETNSIKYGDYVYQPEYNLDINLDKFIGIIEEKVGDGGYVVIKAYGWLHLWTIDKNIIDVYPSLTGIFEYSNNKLYLCETPLKFDDLKPRVYFDGDYLVIEIRNLYKTTWLYYEELGIPKGTTTRNLVEYSGCELKVMIDVDPYSGAEWEDGLRLTPKPLSYYGTSVVKIHKQLLDKVKRIWIISDYYDILVEPKLPSVVGIGPSSIVWGWASSTEVSINPTSSLPTIIWNKLSYDYLAPLP